MRRRPAVETVVCDACVLINLIMVRRLSLLNRLKGLRFVVAPEARAEVTRSRQIKELEKAFSKRWLREVPLIREGEAELKARLSRDLDEGESASLALASGRGWMLASDEAGILVSMSEKELGKDRQIGTVWLLREAIHQGLLGVEEADSIKAELERCQFAMTFRSFSELI